MLPRETITVVVVCVAAACNYISGKVQVKLRGRLIG